MRVKIVAAAAADRLAMRDGNRFFVRTPYGPDQDIPWSGDPAMMIAALVSKWGFLPVIGPNGEAEPEIDAAEVAIVEPTKAADGSDVWRVVEVIPYEGQP